MRSCWVRLVDQILRLTCGAGELVSHQEQPWASATFHGTRHTVAVSFTGDYAIPFGEEMIELLPEHDFAIPGTVTADVGVQSVLHEAGALQRLIVTFEVLMLDDTTRIAA